MLNVKHFLISVLLTFTIILMGSFGYMLIEGWSFFDSFYMTIITLTTVGFSEIHEVSKAGRLFTVFIIFIGAGFLLYVTGSVVQFMVEGKMRMIMGRRILDNKIKKLSNHYIVCGYGRIGRVLSQNLIGSSLNLVIIEKNQSLAHTLDSDKMLYLIGDAANESILNKAGIAKAKGLVAALATDTDNVFLVLTARQLRQDLFIMARSSHQDSRSKLIAAGANKVESPYDMGAVSMAMRILRPTVTNFIDIALAHQRKEIQMEELPVNAASPLVNVMLRDSGIRQNFKLIIISIKKADGSMLFNPSFETVIRTGDTVIAVGNHENLMKLAKILNPEK